MEQYRGICRPQNNNDADPNGKPGRGRGGFTLLEVMIVIFIMGALAAGVISK